MSKEKYISVRLRKKRLTRQQQEKQFQLGNDDNAQYGALLLLLRDHCGLWPLDGMALITKSEGGTKMVKSASFTENGQRKREIEKKKLHVKC